MFQGKLTSNHTKSIRYYFIKTLIRAQAIVGAVKIKSGTMTVFQNLSDISPSARLKQQGHNENPNRGIIKWHEKVKNEDAAVSESGLFSTDSAKRQLLGMVHGS